MGSGLTDIEEARTANMRLAQWRVTWLSQVQCFYEAFVQADSLVLLSPPLRQAQKRCASLRKKKKPTDADKP